MAAFHLVDAYCYGAGFDFTGESNRIQGNVEVAALNANTFRGGWAKYAGGLKSLGLDMAGVWGSATSQAVDPEAWAALGVADRVFTIGAAEAQPSSPVSILGETGVAYLFRGEEAQYALGGEVGTVAPFTIRVENSQGHGAVRGHLLKAKGTVSATGQLGSTYDTLGFGVSATQALYCTFHNFVPGTTITVQVQSDDNTGFSSPTTIGTIGPVTVSGGSWLRVAGPITDRYLRCNVSAITGTHTVAAAMAIG